MNEFIFRFPSDVPPMTFEALRAYVNENTKWTASDGRYAMIGSTIRVTWKRPGEAIGFFEIQLYKTIIARIYRDQIWFPNDDPHKTTTEWVSRIVRDNGLGTGVCRVRRRKADGPGPWMSRGQAGLLVIDGDRTAPVHGRIWTVNRERIARNLEHAERWAAEMAFRHQDPEQWSADLATAAGQQQGMPDYRDRVDPRYWQGTRHRPSLSDIR